MSKKKISKKDYLAKKAIKKEVNAKAFEEKTGSAKSLEMKKKEYEDAQLMVRLRKTFKFAQHTKGFFGGVQKKGVPLKTE